MQGVIEKEAESLTAKQRVREAHKCFLKSVPLFSDFPDKALNEVLGKAIFKEYAKGKMLFLVGDNVDYFYVIIDGWVKLFRETRDGHESVIAVLTNGDMFGRCAVLKNSSFPYSSAVMTKCQLLMIPSDFMMHMAGNHTEYDDFLNRFLEGEFGERNQGILEAEHLAQMTSAERVGCFLLKICSNRQECSFTFQLPYEKALVAGRLGMTPETFSRSLNQLKEIGVESNHAEVTIHNIEQLQARICEHCSATKGDCFLAQDEKESDY